MANVFLKFTDPNEVPGQEAYREIDMSELKENDLFKFRDNETGFETGTLKIATSDAYEDEGEWTVDYEDYEE